jgi:hypothetical protein
MEQAGRLLYPAQCPRCERRGRTREEILHSKRCALLSAWGRPPYEDDRMPT